MKRIIRRALSKEFIAVDIQDASGKVISTPLYLSKDKTVNVEAFDQEENKFFKTELTFNGERILARDIDIKSPVHGMEWEVETSDLRDENLFRFK